MSDHDRQRPAARGGALRHRDEVRAMFGRIVPRYDLMNRLMTVGRDAAWRGRAVRLAIGDGAECVLDIATGTGDLALALAKGGARRVVGVDFAAPMIQAATAKGARHRLNETAGRPSPPVPVWAVADALSLPFPDESFDACTVSFGLRNMADYEAAVREIARVLRPGGRFVCLELTPYRRPVLGRVFNAYFSRVVPVVGGLLSGDREAYRYLPRSVAAFPDAASLAALCHRAGLPDVTYHFLGAGAVALHLGRKPSAA